MCETDIPGHEPPDVELPADISFDAELLTASFPLRLSADVCSEGGCREKMQIYRLVGLRFFLANEVVSLYSPTSFPSKPLVFII